jgi:ferrous iron transport protein B
MLSGFACAIPAVMATRTIESRKDRLITMLALPFTSCSARLPIYLLVVATVFNGEAPVLGVLSVGALVLLSMYSLSVVAALSAAAVLRRTVLKAPRPTLILELPPYRRPLFRNLAVNVGQQVRSFLVEAGTVILSLTIILWVLLSYPRLSETTEVFAARQAEAANSLSGEALEARRAELTSAEAGQRLRESVAGRLGHVLEPALEPLGFDWRIGIGILGAFAAREVFVSTLGIVFDIADADESNESLREALKHATWPDGRPLLTPLSGVCLMVFFVLACQCMSTLGVVARESRSWKWPAFLFTYMTVLAYVVTLILYQTGHALGIGV